MFDFRKYYYLWPVALLGAIVLLAYGGYLVSQSESSQRLSRNLAFVMDYDEIEKPVFPDSLKYFPKVLDSLKLAYYEKTLSYPLSKIDSLYLTIYNPKYKRRIDSLGAQWDEVRGRLRKADSISKVLAKRVVELDSLSSQTLKTEKLDERIQSLEESIKSMKEAIESLPPFLSPDPSPGLSGS